jgi:non-specific serine/threonine protein kinase
MHRAITTFERLQMSGHLEAAKGTLGHLGGGAKTPAGGALAPDAHVDDPEATRGAPDLYVFRREGDFWTIVFAGTVLRLRHTRGLALLSLLLQRPDAEMHVLDLVGALAGGLLVDGDPGHKRCGRRPRNELEGIQGDAGPLIDVRARQEYRRRVEELRSELAEAEGFNDIGRASTLRAEIEQLTGELKRAYGTNGPRMAASATERARVSVRNNISNTLNILRRLDQNLWRHLDAAVRTGTYCSYRPERAIPWTF